MAEFDPDAWLANNPPPPAPEAIPAPRRQYAAAEVPGAAISNVPASAKKFATGIYEAVTNPLDTLGAVADLGSGALRLAVPEQVRNFFDQYDSQPQSTERATQLARAAGGMLADRYGSWESIKRTVAEDPVGAAADLSTILSGGASVAGMARMPTVASGLQTAATATNPLSAVALPARGAVGAYRQMVPHPLQVQQAANAPRDAAFAQARSAGYVTTPGSIAPTSGRFVVAERLAGKSLLEQLMSVRNQDTTNAISRRAIGVADDVPLTRERLSAVRREEFRRGYDPINQVGRIVVDNDYIDDLANIERSFSGASGSFPQAVPNPVRALVFNHLEQQFNSADAVRRIQQLREGASAAFRRSEPELGHAQRAVANALESQIERGILASGNPNATQVLNQFRQSRQRMAMIHAVEDAIEVGTGNVSAARLASDLQGGAYLTGDLRMIAEFANRFPRVNRLPSQIGTPSSGAVMGLDTPRVVAGMLGAAAGGMAGGGGGAIAGGVGAGAAQNALSAVMRNYLMRPGTQALATPNYMPMPERLLSDPSLRNMLLMQQAGEMSNQLR
jgi:hypothetical protein